MKAGEGLYRGLAVSALMLGALTNVAQAQGPEIRWQPISATGPHTLVDNEGNEGVPSEIILDSGGVDVELEIHVSGWGTAPGSPSLGAYQGTIDSSGYASGLGAPLVPKGWPDDPGAYAFIDSTRTDFVFYGLVPIPAVSVFTLNYEYGSTALLRPAEDGGGIYYGGTLTLEVPADAAGTYQVQWNPADFKTFLNNEAGVKISANATPALITVTFDCSMDEVIEEEVFPPSCAVDARQPHVLDDAADKYGWTELVLPFSCDPTGLNLQTSDFSVWMDPFGSPPSISSVVTDGAAQTVTLTLDPAITPGHWTCIAHDESGKRWCMGYLPGDTDQNARVQVADITALIDSINAGGSGNAPEYATDGDRSGVTNAQDLLRLIDLLNGAMEFDAWLGQALPRCPA